MPESKMEFKDVLSITAEGKIIPAGVGVRVDEWDDTQSWRLSRQVHRAKN
jgi:hypothetical protein